jgi:hypothetical protein
MKQYSLFLLNVFTTQTLLRIIVILSAVVAMRIYMLA